MSAHSEKGQFNVNMHGVLMYILSTAWKPLLDSIWYQKGKTSKNYKSIANRILKTFIKYLKKIKAS